MAMLERTTRHDATTFTCFGTVKTAYPWNGELAIPHRNRFRIIRETGGWQVDRSGWLPWETAIRVSPEGELTFGACGNRAKAAVFSSYAKAFTALRGMLSKVHPTNKVAWL